jgi:hypothetical protein
MKNPRLVKAEVLIMCDVLVDDVLVEGITHQYKQPKNDEDAATQLLFAMVNPKMVDKSFSGNWDGVCGFEGRFMNINVSTN